MKYSNHLKIICFVIGGLKMISQICFKQKFLQKIYLLIISINLKFKKIMKKLELNQMEKVQGAFDCSQGGQVGFLTGALVGGGVFFGAGAIVALGFAAGYVALRCNKEFNIN